MQVFAIKASGDYAEGMAVVAAPNEEDAKALAQSYYKRAPVWEINYMAPDDIAPLPVQYDGPSTVLAFFESGS